MHKKTNRNILIIEDESDFTFLLNIILSDKDYDIEHVNTLDKAIQSLQKKQPALILLDNKLPDGYGLDFLSYLRNDYPGIKIIMISGFHPTKAKEIALEYGVDAFLKKPFTKQEVCNSIQELLN